METAGERFEAGFLSQCSKQAKYFDPKTGRYYVLDSYGVSTIAQVAEMGTHRCFLARGRNQPFPNVGGCPQDAPDP
jgi:hypothetical protein